MLERAARAAGNSPDLTQGGGGNVSLKIGPERMFIKASGVRLKDVSAAGGYALVNYGNIRRYIADRAGGEGEFSDYINSQTLPVKGVPSATPSIETGFHSLLNNAVIHTHSVYANILCDSEEGGKVVSSLFPDSVMAPYFSPGMDLCSFVCAKAAKDSRQIFFLGNHGLAISHAGAEAALALNSRVNSVIKEALGLPAYPVTGDCFSGLSPHNRERLGFYGKDFILKNILSPDQALYCDEGALDGNGNMRDVNEALTACFYILDNIRALGFTPKFLSQGDIRRLNSLRSGRYSGR